MLVLYILYGLIGIALVLLVIAFFCLPNTILRDRWSL